MTTFDDREKAFEDKFAHDADLVFRARARRNRLFGEWLAGEMGLSGDAVKDYAGSIVAADLEEEGDADVVRKVAADLEGSDVSMTDAEIETKLNSFMDAAKSQIMSET
ncbi:MAG: DUF1476 domain-containing protein [Kordiimonadaceae bacterium]|nr:DUF1476 domain-containing protein [Kordiimonadaceae bacterium]MBO6569973.1 DUF1476 domain-containing protein [Kordiimonadaceae bacterium]MBO6965930.1 DUF1476 domain-containing protein [Kordiimonadaceae bacterium]